MGELAGRAWVDLGWERKNKSHRANICVEIWGTELRIMENHDKLPKRWVLNDIASLLRTDDYGQHNEIKTRDAR